MKIKGLAELLKTTLGGQENKIAILEQDLENKDNELQQKDKELTQKNDHLALLSKVLKASIKVFRSRQQKLTDTIKELEKEQAKNKENTEYQNHLTKDIENLNGQNKELTDKIKELETVDKDNEKLRDEELNKLRQENQQLKEEQESLKKRVEKAWSSMDSSGIDWNQLITNVNIQRQALVNWKTNFLNQTPQQVKEQIDNLKQELEKEKNAVLSLNEELTKEKGWFDEFGKDERDNFVIKKEAIKDIPLFDEKTSNLIIKIELMKNTYTVSGESFLTLNIKKDLIMQKRSGKTSEYSKIKTAMLKKISEYYKLPPAERERERDDN